MLCRCDVLDLERVRLVTHEIQVSWQLCTTSPEPVIVRWLCRVHVRRTGDAGRGDCCRCDGYSLKPPFLYVLMEMCSGSLHKLLHGKAQTPLTPATRQHLALQAAKGVAHLHSHTLVHRCNAPCSAVCMFGWR